MQQDKIQKAAQQLAASCKKSSNASERRGALVVLDQKPPVGDNTTIMLYAAKLRATDEQKPTAYFSLGTPSIKVVNRLLAITTGISQEKIDSGQLDDKEWKQLDERLPQLTSAPLYIDDTPAMPIAELKQKLTDLLETAGVRLAIIDHAEQLTAKGQPADTAYITAHAKAIAEQLGITIITILDKD